MSQPRTLQCVVIVAVVIFMGRVFEFIGRTPTRLDDITALLLSLILAGAYFIWRLKR